jgi:adenosyl cobinamide kinase/adenosyl cobinamide phosphate guanylyltransferase
VTLTLVTGGARSGKSQFAERLAQRSPQPVLYVATAEVLDDEMRARVHAHRSRRPGGWQTLEARREIGIALAGRQTRPATVLLDDLGLLVTNHLLDLCGPADPTVEMARALDAALATEIDALARVQADGGWDLIVVTNEVGLGIVPATPLGRVFRDALGRANQALAARADAVFLLVAGLPLRIKPPCEHLGLDES